MLKTGNGEMRREDTEMETHSSVLAWRIPGTGGPGGLTSMGSWSAMKCPVMSYEMSMGLE